MMEPIINDARTNEAMHLLFQQDIHLKLAFYKLSSLQLKCFDSFLKVVPYNEAAWLSKGIVLFHKEMYECPYT